MKNTYYRRHVTVKIPSDIQQDHHAGIYAKAAELNALFAKDAGGSSEGCVQSAAVVISSSGFSACLIAGAEPIK